MTKDMNRSSFVLKLLTSGLGILRRSPLGIRVKPKRPAMRMVAPVAQVPWASNELSTISGSPVRSRWKRAAEMPPAMVRPPITSPKAGPGWDSGYSPGLLMMSAGPPRPHHAELS